METGLNLSKLGMNKLSSPGYSNEFSTMSLFKHSSVVSSVFFVDYRISLFLSFIACLKVSIGFV